MEAEPLSPPIPANNRVIVDEIGPATPTSSPQIPRRIPPINLSPPPEPLDNPDNLDFDNYTNITIAFPSIPLPAIIHHWQTFLIYFRLRVLPLLLRRNIIFYIVLFLVLQFGLMIFYQHQAYSNNSIEFKRGRRAVESDLEVFVNGRKDASNSSAVLFVDMKNKDWVLNFINDLKKLKMNNYMLFARDKQACASVDRQACYVLKTAEHHTTAKGYKYAVWQSLLELGVHILAVEPDTVFMENPILYFDHTVDLNIMLEYPSAITSKWSQDLEKAGLCCSGQETYYNSGFFYLKSSIASLRLIIEMRAKEDVGLQEALNLGIQLVPSLKVRKLDKDMFSNGFVGFLESSAQHKKFDTIAYKLNWADQGGKLNRARELLHWHLDPIERYTQPRKYLTYTSEDDWVSLQVEHDHLVLAYFVAKVLGRSLILPKFHCYIGQPATCYVDALFDSSLMDSSDVYENSFLKNSLVPHENLRRKKLSLRKFPSVAELIDFLEPLENMPLIDLTFPKVELEGKHLSLQMFEDRTSTEILTEHSSAAEVAVRLNINGLFSPSFTNELQQKLNSQSYTCVVTAPFKLNVLIERIKEIGHKLVYVVSHDPTLPTHQEAKKTLQAKLQNILFGYESSWTGHKLLPHHTAAAHIQMSACAQADHVLINSWEPTWLIGGICEMRKALGVSPACEFLLQDPWIVDPWKHI